MLHKPTHSPSLVTDLFGHRVRVRVCALYREGDKLLMVRHRGLGTSAAFWSPPGGGVEFGETVADALRREVQEETGLIIEVRRLVCVNEFVSPPLHAIELFFEVQQTDSASGGQLQVGSDPEMTQADQLIVDVRLLTFEQIKGLPANEVHGLFGHCHSLDEVFALHGYIH